MDSFTEFAGGMAMILAVCFVAILLMMTLGHELAMSKFEAGLLTPGEYSECQ
jgi:Kef-type K+ transport system membrane component KefB